MPEAKPWTFRQLTKPNKVLVLSAWNAPMGRPRVKPVVSDGVKLRRKSTRYPDSQGTVTHHVFGSEENDLDLNGRFRARDFPGISGVRDQIQLWKSFVRDGVLCSITWGDITQFIGLVDEFVPGRESEVECTWTMKICVSSDVFGPQGVANQVAMVDHVGRAAEIALRMKTITNIATAPAAAAINNNFFDTIDDVVSVLTGATGQFVNFANQISNFESAAVTEILRLRAGIEQLRTAALTMQRTMDSAQQDSMYIQDNADATLAWLTLKTSAFYDSQIALALLADLDLKAEIATRGVVDTTVRGVAGDTWEKISMRAYQGDPSGADRIRRANGAKYGSLPPAGKLIHIPVAL